MKVGGVGSCGALSLGRSVRALLQLGPGPGPVCGLDMTGPPRQRLLRKQKQHIPKLTRLFPLPASRGAPNKKESTRKTRMSTNQHDGAQTWDLSDCGPHGAAPPQGPAQTATLSEVFLWAPRRSSVTRTKPKPLL